MYINTHKGDPSKLWESLIYTSYVCTINSFLLGEVVHHFVLILTRLLEVAPRTQILGATLTVSLTKIIGISRDQQTTLKQHICDLELMMISGNMLVLYQPSCASSRYCVRHLAILGVVGAVQHSQTLQSV